MFLVDAMYLENKVPRTLPFRTNIVRFLLHVENSFFLWEAVISSQFSRLTDIIVALKHVNNYYGSKYSIIIAIFMKRNFNFSFTILDIAAT